MRLPKLPSMRCSGNASARRPYRCRTKNWDGRLAAEFQQDLVTDPRVRHHPRLLELVRDQPSFEIPYGMTHKYVSKMPLSDVFPPDQSTLSELERIVRAFFGS
jgi:hypothetical protein